MKIIDHYSIGVNGQWQMWNKERELIIFDDSYIHEAKNENKKMRTVLILSLWNPRLNSEEIIALQNTFNKRKQETLKLQNKLKNKIAILTQ
ncbi:hypothetical protein MAH1_36650 [Sessilibacter sp. MAH1]